MADASAADTEDSADAGGGAGAGAGGAGGDVSKNEQKRRLKLAAKEKAAVEKAAEKAAKAAAAPPKAAAAGGEAAAAAAAASAAAEEEVDPSKYFENRTRQLAGWAAQGVAAYPHKFQVTMSVPAFVTAFGSVPDGTTLGEVTVSLAGRLMASRAASGKLQFYDLHSEGKKVQIMFKADLAADAAAYAFVRDNVRRGDIVGFTGCPGKSNKGELSLFPTSAQILTPCMRMMPKSFYGLVDKETRFRQRYLDLMLNDDVRCDAAARQAQATSSSARRSSASLPFLHLFCPLHLNRCALRSRSARRSSTTSGASLTSAASSRSRRP